MRALVPIFHAFVKHGNDVFLPSALDNHKVLDEESVLCVPTASQYPTAGVQQISELFVVDLSKRCLHVELFLAHGHCFPHEAHSLKKETVIRHIRFPMILANIFLVAHHSESLAGTSLSIRKDRRTVALQRTVNQLVHPTSLENLSLATILIQDSVKCELLRALSWHTQHHVGLTLYRDDVLVISDTLVLL